MCTGIVKGSTKWNGPMASPMASTVNLEYLQFTICMFPANGRSNTKTVFIQIRMPIIQSLATKLYPYINEPKHTSVSYN